MNGLTGAIDCWLQMGVEAMKMVETHSDDCLERSCASLRKDAAVGKEGTDRGTMVVPNRERIEAWVMDVFGSENMNECPMDTPKTSVQSPTDKGRHWCTFQNHSCGANCSRIATGMTNEIKNCFVSSAVRKHPHQTGTAKLSGPHDTQASFFAFFLNSQAI